MTKYKPPPINSISTVYGAPSERMQTSSYEANHVFLTGKCLKEEKFIYRADENISLQLPSSSIAMTL